VFAALKTITDRLEGSNVMVSGQDCSTQNEFGAHTGEVTAGMLKDVGCSYVIIAHSERRQLYGETDESANRKVKAALAADVRPIYCIGELLAEREAGRAESVVETQLNGGLQGLTPANMERIIIAYEPVWAIGTGKTATPEQAQEMHGHIRGVIAKTHGGEPAGSLRILYGGSVKPDNIRYLMAKADVDGALVGGASLEAESFARIVNYK